VRGLVQGPRSIREPPDPRPAGMGSGRGVRGQADPLAPRRVGSLVFPITQSYVSDVLLVDDHSIRSGQRALWRALRLVAEPAGAVGVAALLTGAYRPVPSERVALVISGANTTPSSIEAS